MQETIEQIEIVTTWDEFRDKWTGSEQQQNFLLRGEVFPFQFAPPPLQTVIEALRKEPSTRVLKGFTHTDLLNEPFPEFRDLPIQEAMRASANVAHFDVRHFAGPGQVFEGLNAVFDQWYQSLAQHGFSWNEEIAQRAFFYSAPHCATGYHFDSSYVLVCQVEVLHELHEIRCAARFIEELLHGCL